MPHSAQQGHGNAATGDFSFGSTGWRWNEDSQRRETILPAARGEERERWTFSVDFISTKRDARHVINAMKDNLERIRSEKRPLRMMACSEFSMGKDVVPSDLEDFKEAFPQGAQGEEAGEAEAEAYYERAARHFYKAAKIRLRRQMETTMILGRQSRGGRHARLEEAKLMLEKQRELKSPADLKSAFLEEQSLRIRDLEAEVRQLKREKLYLSSKHDPAVDQRKQQGAQEERSNPALVQGASRSVREQQDGPSRHEYAPPLPPQDSENTSQGLDADPDSEEYALLMAAVARGMKPNDAVRAQLESMGIKLMPRNPLLNSPFAQMSLTPEQRLAHAQAEAVRAALIVEAKRACSIKAGEQPSAEAPPGSALSAIKSKKRPRDASDYEGEQSGSRPRSEPEQHEAAAAAEDDEEAMRRDFERFKKFRKFQAFEKAMRTHKKIKSEAAPPPQSSSSESGSDHDSDADMRRAPSNKRRKEDSRRSKAGAPASSRDRNVPWTESELDNLRRACRKSSDIVNWRACLVMVQHKLSKRNVHRSINAIAAKICQLGLLPNIAPPYVPQDSAPSGSKGARK